MIRSPRIASAAARGAAASMVMMVPPEKMTSAVSCAHAGRVKTAGAKGPYRQRQRWTENRVNQILPLCHLFPLDGSSL